MNCRNSFGRNDNPSAVEFAAAFKRLLVCHPLTTSVDHNIITDATGILTVPSTYKIKFDSATNQKPIAGLAAEFDLKCTYEAVMMEEIEAMEPYEQHMCAYIALCIEKKFIQNTQQHKEKCGTCAAMLLDSSEIINDDLLAMNVSSAEDKKQPSSSTLKLVIFANAMMKRVFDENQQGLNLDAVQKIIADYINIDDLYNDFDLKHIEQDEPSSFYHKINFINLLIKTYMTMKSRKIGKKLTEAQQGKLIRFKNKRTVILNGQ